MESQPWQECLREAVRDISVLSQELGFSSIPDSWDANPDFPLLVPRPFLQRIKQRDENDPLLLQVVPLKVEHENHQDWVNDPLNEQNAVLESGLLKKYFARVLVIAAPVCAVNCRYCFRRHFPYEEHRSFPIHKTLDQIGQDPSLTEVILSGGEPLLLSDAKIREVLDRLDKIEHVKRIRIHTRLPVVIPQRVTDALIGHLKASRKKTIVVLHFNHANEIDDDVANCVAELRDTGVTLLNQSVLLSRVNDDAQALTDLSERLFEIDVLPYYLHLMDRVNGTTHFDIPRQRAVEIHRELQARLPGYLVPRLVREQPGRPAKELIAV